MRTNATFFTRVVVAIATLLITSPARAFDDESWDLSVYLMTVHVCKVELGYRTSRKDLHSQLVNAGIDLLEWDRAMKSDYYRVGVISSRYKRKGCRSLVNEYVSEYEY